MSCCFNISSRILLKVCDLISFRGNSDNSYKPRSQAEREVGYYLASAATALAYKALPSFSNPFLKQMTKEHANNHLYKDVFTKAVDMSGLKKAGLQIINSTNPVDDVGKGLNAYFNSQKKIIVLNTNKASITGFHELGHAFNYMKGGVGKFLQKLRGPGMYFAGLMGTVALFSRNKPKEAKRNFLDVIQDNCGKIAFISMLPVVAEEALASYRGIQFAKKAGLKQGLVNNLKKFYGKALLSYGGYALVAGVAAFLASKITEAFTRPKKSENLG